MTTLMNAMKYLKWRLNNMKYQIECGKTFEEYKKNFGEAYYNGLLWDFSAEDVNGGAIDLDPEQVYWEIDGRLYETKVL